MDRPNLSGRVPDTIATRLPGGESDEGGIATGGTDDGAFDPDTARGDTRRWTTLLTLSGLGLAALGVVLRYVLDRRGDGEADAEADSGGPHLDRDRRGTVEIVGDAGTEAAEPAERTERETEADEGEATADTGGAAPSPAVTATDPDVTVETFEADRTADGDDAAVGEDDTDAAREGPPRIAPLVGTVALIGMRLFVERVGKRVGDVPGVAGQL